MKIVYIITGLSIGGAETITVNLAEQICQFGNSVIIMYLTGEQKIKVSNEIEVIPLNMKKSLLGFILALKKARRFLKKYKPDVVHANMFHSIIFSRILRIFVKIPRLICTEHSNNYHGIVRKTIEHCTDFLSDVNTNVSIIATENFIKNKIFSAKKTKTVYNGINLKRFALNKNLVIRNEYGIKDNDFVFINVSRLNPAKDHRCLINAFSIVHKQIENTKLLCVGSGELENELKDYAKKCCLEDSVLFIGSKVNVEDYYNASDCFVLSSEYEGFGLAVAEAMACELPVISTDCGGTSEIIQDNKWLVPIKDVEQLSSKMIYVINLPLTERAIIGKNNRDKVQCFSIETITEQWLMIYGTDFI